MQRLEVSGAVRPIYGSLGVRRLIEDDCRTYYKVDSADYDGKSGELLYPV